MRKRGVNVQHEFILTIMRRALIILASLVVILGIGVAVYFYFFANTASIIVAPKNGSSLPAAGQTARVGDDATTTPIITASLVTQRLVRISTGPVARGLVVVDVPATNASSSSDVAVNYIERQSGNIFRYLTHARTITRTSNRTVPGIETASWLPDASIAFVRYLSGADFSTANTYALPANGASGFFLPQNLSDIAVASTSVLMLASGVNGSAASIERPDGTNTKALFTTPLSSLRASFAGKERYLAFTRPSATLGGDAFLVDAVGLFSHIVGPHNGLVALASPSVKWVLVSYTRSNEMQMELVNTTTRETLPLPVATIADKCVWAVDDSGVYCGVPANPSANYVYPDDWYQGAVQFSDRIWKIDVAGRYAQLVLDFSKEAKVSLDAQALALDSANTTLAFINKTDGSLWVYQL